jgi:hypothetical protein
MVDGIVSHNAVESSISVKTMLRLPAGGGRSWVAGEAELLLSTGGTDVALSETARLFYAVKLLQNETLVLMKNSGDQRFPTFWTILLEGVGVTLPMETTRV